MILVRASPSWLVQLPLGRTRKQGEWKRYWFTCDKHARHYSVAYRAISGQTSWYRRYPCVVCWTPHRFCFRCLTWHHLVGRFIVCLLTCVQAHSYRHSRQGMNFIIACSPESFGLWLKTLYQATFPITYYIYQANLPFRKIAYQAKLPFTYPTPLTNSLPLSERTFQRH